MVGLTHLGILFGLEFLAYYGVERLIDLRDPEYRESELGSSLENHPGLRYLYVFVFMAWWATTINPELYSVWGVAAMGIWGGVAASGWDIILHGIVKGIQGLSTRWRHAKERADRRRARMNAEEESEDSVEGKFDEHDEEN